MIPTPNPAICLLRVATRYVAVLYPFVRLGRKEPYALDGLCLIAGTPEDEFEEILTGVEFDARQD